METLDLNNKRKREKLTASEWNSLIDAINLLILRYNLGATIPTKLSQLINDAGFITDISGKADKSDLARVATTGSYNDLKDKPDLSNIGSAGKSAYELAVENGYQGTIQLWLLSLKGQDGTNGTNGQDGTNGTDGITPHIDPTSKHWMIGETDTGIVAEGLDGVNGQNGFNGITPHIDPTTGNWFIGETNTGVSAQGPAGPQGPSVLSDWDESDISSLSYIKNRPFYGSTGYTVIYNETINCNQNGPTHGGTSFTPTEELIVGQTYKVTIDSDEYIVKAVSPLALNLNEDWSTPFNDTWSIFKSGNYYSLCINGAIGQTKIIKVEKQTVIVEKQLDSEYVNLSNYYSKTESDNKFTPVQSNWATNNTYDLSYIMNKPFGVETYLKSEKVLEGTFNRDRDSGEGFEQVYWHGNIPTNILSEGDYIRLVINGEDRGDYAKVLYHSTLGWKVVYYDDVNGYVIYPCGNNSELNFYGYSSAPATNLPSGDTISVEIWKCTLGETKLDNKYVDYENSVYINNIKNSIPKIWSGTQAQYDLIQSPDSNTIYIITAASS